MKNLKYPLLIITFLFIVGLNTASAQPPPPIGGPPCWPPPCIPVDNGILFAIGAAVIFGAAMIYRSYRMRVAGK